ncbi:MAG: outer membrane protein assembly factor BamD [Mariprofundaceae bacterium]
MKKFILCFTVLFLLAGCSGKELAPSESAKIDYEKTKAYLDIGEYGKAGLFLESFAAQHPYSQYTVQAELLRIFAVYKNSEYLLSETLSEEFIKRHPRHPDVAYAKYLLAMTHFKQVSREDRDQSVTKLTIDAFETLIKQHPESIYAKDAMPRLQMLYNKLSSHELTVGKYYFAKERYVAAANRFKVVLDKYQTTPAIEEALYYLAASYSKLGITESTREITILLQHNYPKSEWSSQAAELL